MRRTEGARRLYVALGIAMTVLAVIPATLLFLSGLAAYFLGDLSEHDDVFRNFVEAFLILSLSGIFGISALSSKNFRLMIASIPLLIFGCYFIYRVLLPVLVPVLLSINLTI
jgi:hypothetical protein